MKALPGGRAELPARTEQLRALMVRYQAGEARAVEELVGRLSPALLRFLSGPQLQVSDAEDILQETWLRIHRARHTYRPSEPLLPWVFAIARHAQLDGFRRRQRRGRHEVLVPEVPEPARGETGTARAPDILRLLDELPGSQKEVVWMLKVSGMSLEDVARTLGSSVGAIKQKAHRAYSTLRKRLEKGA